MKKLLFSAYSLDVGGIETALITLLKNISTKYDITLVLEKKQGIFLDQVPQNIKIITYTPSDSKIICFRKISNFLKQLLFKIKYKNKFDFSACYATYSFPCSFTARAASKNSALWVHNDYMNFYDNDLFQYRKFFKDLRIEEFRKIIFVSELDKRVFMAQFPECSKKALMCHNLIDYNVILKQANEEIDDFNRSNEITFINIGRHDEKQKKLTRIIEATRKLNQEGYKFRVIFVGKGTDTTKYKEEAKDLKNIEFLGAKKNPYPYLKRSDCLLMSSQFEGYPVVFVEAQILEKPIITTEVSDSMKDIKDKHGIVVENSVEGVYKGMKNFIKNQFIPEKFNAKEYNREIIEKIDKIIENDK